MRKIFLVLVLVLLSGGCRVVDRSKLEPTIKPDSTGVEEDGVGEVSLVIDDGERVASYSAGIEQGESVLDLLRLTAENKGLKLVVREYDFGDLVESIGGKMNSKERAWIYFVNGQAGDVGAGEKKLVGGERVEWKYIKPIY